MRELKYREAITEGLVQSMEDDPNVFVMGPGISDPKGIFGTTLAAFKRFGSARVWDTPLAENALTGACIGAAQMGMRPVLVHARNDFMLLTFDQLINNAAKWSYMSGGAFKIPMTIRAIVGRGWGQGPQHSQSLQALFSHTPGLKVVMPATPEDAKGLLMSSISEDCPVIVLEHRQLYEKLGTVPYEPYRTPLGKGIVRREGNDVTIVAISYMVYEALEAAERLNENGVSVEVIDLRTVCPFDEDLIFESVAKTGRLVVADTAFRNCGVAGEIAARVVDKLFGALKSGIRRVTLPDVPTPTSWALEALYYPDIDDIVQAVKSTLDAAATPVQSKNVTIASGPRHPDFHGPF
jgi:pyruvate/2-oxoglutarate/acetoin dehydrogenase E1 component